MHHSRQRRLRPASIVPLVSLIILLGTAAWAEVSPIVSRAHPDGVTRGLAASLAQPSDPIPARTALLRADLLSSEQHDLLIRRRIRTAWRGPDAMGRAAPTASPAGLSSAASASPVLTAGANWYAIAQCESSGVWSANTGNGYWGGLQFAPSTWFAYGGGPFDGVGPFPYSSATQIAVAERVLAAQGPGAWPNCFVWG